MPEATLIHQPVSSEIVLVQRDGLCGPGDAGAQASPAVGGVFAPPAACLAFNLTNLGPMPVMGGA